MQRIGSGSLETSAIPAATPFDRHVGIGKIATMDHNPASLEEAVIRELLIFAKYSGTWDGLQAGKSGASST
jgi:hypothetical protein